MHGMGAESKINGSTNRMAYIDRNPQTYVEGSETTVDHAYDVTDYKI